MKNICVVIPQGLPVPAVRGGAIETLIEELITVNEQQQRVKFTVICVDDENARCLAKQYKYTKIVFRGPYADGIIFKMYSFIARVIHKITGVTIPIKKNYDKKVEQFILSHKDEFDAIVNESSNFYAFKRISKIMGAEKVVAHLHCKVLANKYLDTTYGKVITVSEFIKNYWLQTSNRPADEVIVVKNGINIPRFGQVVTDEERKKIRESIGCSEQDFLILYCGRIVPQKGIKELIKGVLLIEDYDVKLVIIGSPKFGNATRSAYQNEVKSIVDRNNERIRFTGFIHNSEVYKFYKIADLAVVPSTYEDPAPLVPIECMAVGLPLIVTNTGGAWEYVTEDNSIKVIKENDLPKQISEAIMLLKNDKEKRKTMSTNAMKQAQNFSVEMFYKDFCDVFDVD